MKAVWILTGITGGFFIELILMRLTEKLVGNVLRTGNMKSKLLMLISARSIVTLLVLTLAALHSTALMLSLAAGSILYVYLYIIMNNIHIEKAV